MTVENAFNVSGRPCGFCESAPAHGAATLWDNGIGPLLASRPYMGTPICACCATRKQLDFARACAARIPQLEADLADQDGTCSGLPSGDDAPATGDAR